MLLVQANASSLHFRKRAICKWILGKLTRTGLEAQSSHAPADIGYWGLPTEAAKAGFHKPALRLFVESCAASFWEKFRGETEGETEGETGVKLRVKLG